MKASPFRRCKGPATCDNLFPMRDPMRLFDLSVCLIVFTFGAPLFLLCALAVWLDSPGPVFYRQARTGRGGRFYMVWKFRTMNWSTKKGVLLTEAADPRITRSGYWLRRFSLDELPNFINVLRGEMSLIGPRPEVPEITAHYTPFQRQVLSVRPGITGFSAVLFRQEISVARKMRFDNWYLRHRGFCLYLWILAMTPLAVFGGRGNR